MNVAIAATNHDERNSIIALQAKRLGVKNVISITRDPSYAALLEENGITCISVPYATSAMVENFLDRPGLADLFEIEGGVAGLIDINVPADGKFVGYAIQDIDIPDQCVIAAILRDNEFVVPRGKTQILAGDHVVIVGPRDSIQAAHDIFTATKP